MVILACILALLGPIFVINSKNSAVATDENLSFDKIDSLSIFICIFSSILLQMVGKKIKIIDDNFLIFSLVCFGFYLTVFVIINKHREDFIKKRNENIIQIYQSMQSILGHFDIKSIDFSKVPFEFEEDKKTGSINKIIIDTVSPDVKINDDNALMSQQNLGKFFPEMQWTYEHNTKERRLSFLGLPTPPSLVYWPGSDYRPSGFIPLGLTGKGETGWSLEIRGKDLGVSQFVNEDGNVAGNHILPSAPQTLCLGSTGGGKSIYINQIISILK